MGRCFWFVLLAIAAGVLSARCGVVGEILAGQDQGAKVAKADSGENDSGADVPEQAVVTGARAWAMGCCGVLWERNHDRHDILGGREINERNISDVKELLSEWWGIEDRAGLYKSLVWLMQGGGHRQGFAKLGESVSRLSEGEYQALLRKNRSDAEQLNDIRVVRKYYGKVGDKGILGWDLSRYIFLCRFGYVVGYIGEEEAFKVIMPAARQLQETFDSWQDMGKNYLIGRLYWSAKRSEENGYLYEDAYQRMCDMVSSPWNKYDWDMDLGE